MLPVRSFVSNGSPVRDDSTNDALDSMDVRELLVLALGVAIRKAGTEWAIPEQLRSAGGRPHAWGDRSTPMPDWSASGTPSATLGCMSPKCFRSSLRHAKGRSKTWA